MANGANFSMFLQGEWVDVIVHHYLPEQRVTLEDEGAPEEFEYSIYYKDTEKEFDRELTIDDEDDIFYAFGVEVSE